jgi:cardiolipin synthase (CMP-forming)
MFIEEHLQELRRSRFAPAALAEYARRAGASVRADMDANPGGVRSVWIVGLVFFAAAFVAAVTIALTYDRALAYDFLLQTALWILPTFALVTLNIGLLRDRDGFALSALNAPTVLTLLRVTLVPGIALFLSERHLALALGTYLFAALTDVADGWVARRWRMETRLGKVVDPVVDVVFNLAVFFALAAARLLPPWVAAVAALRYGLLLVGGSCITLFVGPLRIQPTVFGRLTGVLMSSLCALVVLLHVRGGAAAEVVLPLTEVALGVLMSATVIHVVVLGWWNLGQMKRKAAPAAQTPGRVVGDVRWGPR